jgi:hypothetical protein
LLGNPTAGAISPEEITLGAGLSFSGTTLVGTGGTVTSLSVVSTNGFAGTVANPTTTPAITLSTTISGILKGNGTAISAAVSDTDYQAPITLTTSGTGGAATFTSNTLNVPNYTTAPGGSSGQVQYNNTTFGGAAGFVYQAAASPNVKIQAQNAAYVPLIEQGAASQTADLNQLQNSGAAVLFGYDAHGRPYTANTTPTIAPGAGLGTTATASISGTDVNGVITLVASSGNSGGTLAVVTFSAAYANAPKTVMILPADNTAAFLNVNSSSGGMVYCSAITTTTFTISVNNNGGLAAASTYIFYYLVIG